MLEYLVFILKYFQKHLLPTLIAAHSAQRVANRFRNNMSMSVFQAFPQSLRLFPNRSGFSPRQAWKTVIYILLRNRALQFLKFLCIVDSCIDLKQFTIYISCIDNFYLKYRYLSCIVN